eukprot:m.125267 g.125267  ORF g.125267 m.125267 type:complete len:370 (+) comp29123_c2_seq1:116-1225(+)
MQACSYSRHGRSHVRVSQIEKPPAPKPHQLLVKVHSASLNPADWKSADGEHAMLFSFAWPRVYGFDFSGEVVQVGSDSTDYSIGDAVFGMIIGLPEFGRGTCAEYVTVESKICARKPATTSHAHAASLPLVAITAVKMLRACGLNENDFVKNKSKRVLITAGSGGVGTIAIQLAKHMFGCGFVAVTASAGPKGDMCTRLGADRVIDYRTQQFEKVLVSTPFNVILDCTGEAKKCIPLLVPNDGGICSIETGGTATSLQTWIRESEADPAKITTGVHSFLMSNWGSGLFQRISGGRSLLRDCESIGCTFAHIIGTGNGEIMAKIATLLEQNKIEAVVDKEFTLQQSGEAIAYQSSGRAAGKVIINVITEH